MNSNDGNPISNNGQNFSPQSGKTIDLQGVASFVGLVELLATELGTSPGKIEGQLPTGPAKFAELIGEIQLNNQGYQRRIMLVTAPGAKLRIHMTCSWMDAINQMPDNSNLSGVESTFVLDATVEQILPQGRALARQLEDAFAVLDRMVTLGHSNKLSSMSISQSKIDAFELGESENLVRTTYPPSGGNGKLQNI
jgi:hypothetical protein